MLTSYFSEILPQNALVILLGKPFRKSPWYFSPKIFSKTFSRVTVKFSPRVLPRIPLVFFFRRFLQIFFKDLFWNPSWDCLLFFKNFSLNCRVKTRPWFFFKFNFYRSILDIPFKILPKISAEILPGINLWVLRF